MIAASAAIGEGLLADDPPARRGTFGARKYLQLARHHKTKKLYGVLDPIDVGYDCHSLPAREVFHADFEILEDGAGLDAGKIRGSLVVKPDFFMPLQHLIDGRNDNGVIVNLAHESMTRQGKHVVGEVFQAFYHGYSIC